MIIPIELRFKADKGTKSAFRTEKTIKSHDVNSVEFHISIDGVNLTDNYTAKILSLFHSSKSQVNTDCEIVKGKIIYKPDTNLISRYEDVTNYVYVYNNNQSLDVCEFLYTVDLSKIDETSLEVKEVYNQSYADLLADFEQALNDYKDTLPQADSVRAEVDEVITQFGMDSQGKLNQYDSDAQQVIADNQTAFDLAEAGRQDSYVQAESERNQLSAQSVIDWKQDADALLETVEGNESVRVVAETTRKTSETDRESSETTRKTNETTRISNEHARKSAEGNRQSTFEENEVGRQSEFEENELARESAESERVSNEAERELNEEERISKDSERDSKIEAVEGLQADLISGAVDSAAVQQHVEERYGQLEEEYAPKLTEVTAQLAQTTYDVSELQAYVGYTDHDIVGIEADLQNRRVTRIAGAVNRTPGASFDNIRAFGGRRRCTVADDGEVLGYYGESGYDETGETGQVMVEQPKFYYKIVPLKLDKIEGGKGFHMRKARYYVSDSPKAGFKVHPAFVDENGKIRPYIYLSAFEGSIFDVSNDTYLKNDEQIADFNADMLSSIRGAKPASGSSQSLSRGNTRKLAQNRGEGWQQAYSATASLTQLLFIVEYASFNTQDALGYGVLNRELGEGNESEITGATTSLGNQSGFIMVNDSEVPTFRGEENWYGNIWEWVDGLNIKPQDIHELYVATHGFADDTGESPYENAGFTLAKSNGYISAFGYTEGFDWLFFPSETSGNSSVPVGDHFYQNAASPAAWLSAILGCHWYSGVDGGGFGWGVNSFSGNSIRTRGGRLVYVPKGGN